MKVKTIKTNIAVLEEIEEVNPTDDIVREIIDKKTQETQLTQDNLGNVPYDYSCYITPLLKYNVKEYSPNKESILSYSLLVENLFQRYTNNQTWVAKEKSYKPEGKGPEIL